MQKLTSHFGRSLLTTTALTLTAAGAASAGTITEGTLPAPIDFSNSSNGFVTPDGTTTVNGSTGFFFPGEFFDNSDWFTFNNLGSGTFSLSANGEGFNS